MKWPSLSRGDSGRAESPVTVEFDQRTLPVARKDEMRLPHRESFPGAGARTRVDFFRRRSSLAFKRAIHANELGVAFHLDVEVGDLFQLEIGTAPVVLG